NPMRPSLFSCCLALLLATSLCLRAEGPFRNRDNPDLHDEAEGTYPIPYQLPKSEEIKAVLERIRVNLEHAMATQVIDARSREPVRDLTVFNADAIAS